MTRLSAIAPTLITTALALSAGAAQAETWAVHAGATCTSDGTTQKLTNGALMNVTPQLSGYSTFSCPVPRGFVTGGPTQTTYVYLNVKATDGPADFYCVLRSVDYLGDIVDSDSLTAPKAVNVPNVKKVWGGVLEVTGSPGLTSYSTILRCQVPNYVALGGGIISYMVRY